MTEDQVERLIGAVDKLGKNLMKTTSHYTLTGADDWQLLLALSAVFAFLLLLLFAMMRMSWIDIKLAIKDQKKDNAKEIDTLWGGVPKVGLKDWWVGVETCRRHQRNF